MGDSGEDGSSHLPTLLFDEKQRIRRLVVLGVAGMFGVWAVAIFIAAANDHVLELPGTGRGLLKHYGYIACVLSGPLVLLNTYYALSYFLRLVGDLDQFLADGVDREAARAIAKPHLESILLQGRWKFLLFLFAFIGAAFSVADFVPLDHPTTYWGNDVFNARYYPASWVVANAYLMFLWSIIYPLGLFYVLHLAVSSQLIVIRLMRQRMLRLNFLHIDRCGGMAKFGTLNLLLMLIYFWMALAGLALHLTHRATYASLVIGAVAITILFFAHSIFGIAWVAKAIRTERDGAVESLNDRIRKMMDTDKSRFTAAVATMAYRDRVMAVAVFPYSGSVSYAVNTLRVAPTMFVVAKHFVPGLASP
jgi:hypothetical protein